MTCQNVIQFGKNVVQIGIVSSSDRVRLSCCTDTMTSTPKRGRANTQGESIIFSPEALVQSFDALRLEAESGFVTNPNLSPFSIILQDGCEEAEDNSAYLDDSQHGNGVKHKEHTFQQDYPILFINTPPGRRELLCNLLDLE